MEPALWQQVKSIVHGALDVPLADRDRWLSLACGNDAQLLTHARTLVRAAGVTAGFLQPSSAVQGSIPPHDPPETEDKSGRTIGHYELVEWVGAGGMGEVYRARDLALGREAALKLLPSSIDPDLRKRLIHEAEASAKLQHPAIATFYEAGESDGETFIAMEFVRGENLRERLQRGAIDPERAIAITCSLLEALAHAHAAGLLHRDIKPENIVIGAHGAKLLDFGIAAPLAGSEPTTGTRSVTAPLTMTAERGLVGTLGYLAPEQLVGDPLDVRTDIFQVGLVLYEMLTGTPAFAGSSFLDRLSAVLMSEIDLTAIGSSGAPAPLLKVLRRALARAPAERYQSARAFLTELREVPERLTSVAIPKVVAVIDLENRTGDNELDWLGSALAESLRASLSKVADVGVIPRQKLHAELLALKQRTGVADPLGASLRLGCGWAITGHLQRSGDMIDVQTRVLDVSTGEVIATRSNRAPVDDLNGMEEGLATAIQSLTGEVMHSEAAGRDRVVEAHECYVKAGLLIDRIGKGSLEDARALLERAVALDERHADALAALAQTYALRSIATTSATDIDAALTFAERALAVAPENVKALIWKGYALSRIDRFDEGAYAYQRAIELAPDDAEAHYFAASGLLFGGRPGTLPLLQRCVELDSRRGMFWLALGTAHLRLEHRKEALYCFRRAHKLENDTALYGTAGAAAYAGEVLRLDGRLDDARRDALSGVEGAERSDHVYRDTFRAYGLCVFGRVALDQQDRHAAEAAFQQVLAQARGRVRTRACGHFVVQALAGLARASRSSQYLDEARRVFESQETYNFGAFYGATNDLTLFELALAAMATGRTQEADELLERAHDAGSLRSLPERI